MERENENPIIVVLMLLSIILGVFLWLSIAENENATLSKNATNEEHNHASEHYPEYDPNSEFVGG